MDDWTTLVKNAVAVLVILLAISVVLFLGYLGLNAANAGGEKLSNTTSSMDIRSFDQYNQTTISGTTVVSGIKNFQNQPVAVVVNTLRNRGTLTSNYNAYLTTDVKAAPKWFEYDISNLERKMPFKEGDSALADMKILPVEKLVTPQILVIEEQNLNLTKANTKADNCYINPTAKFISVLVYDINDQIVGIYMEQLITQTAYNADQKNAAADQWKKFTDSANPGDFLINNLEAWATAGP